MKQLRVTGAVVLAVVIVAIAAAWTMRESKDRLGDGSEDVNRTHVLDKELLSDQK